MRICAAHLPRWCGPLASCAAIGLAATLFAQSPAPAGGPSAGPTQQQAIAPASSQPSAPAAASTSTPTTAPASATTRSGSRSDAPPITEDELRQQFEGKTFYLRGGWLDNNLHFNENGQFDGSSPKASYTLSLVQITRVHMDKHHLEFEGVRYGLHFLGAAPFEEQAVDRVRLTSKKKPLRITIDREEVVAPKKEKQRKENKKKPGAAAINAPGQPVTAPAQPAAPVPLPDQNRHGATVTTSQAHANKMLRDALDAVFAAGIDRRMIATLPPYWQLYYKDVDAKTDYRPADSSILRPSQVDTRARLISVVDPPSNDYAQKNGVAGMSMYHVVVEPDGRAGEIAIGRPIGFGLDESAVDAIRKARFQPAMKDGKPVAVVLDLVVEFRIYSKLTDTASAKSNGPQSPALPGPYSVDQPKPAAEPQPQ